MTTTRLFLCTSIMLFAMSRASAETRPDVHHMRRTAHLSMVEKSRQTQNSISGMEPAQADRNDHRYHGGPKVND